MNSTSLKLVKRCFSDASTLNQKKIGIVGLGNVGTVLRNNLLKGNFKVSFVYDINIDKLRGTPSHIAIAGSPREVAEGSDIIFTALPMPVHVKDAFEGDQGILAGCKAKGLIWVDHSTTDPQQTIELAEMFAQKGGRKIEAPITGGLEACKKGQMTVFMGGEKKVVDEIMPIMNAVYTNVLYTGPLGTANIPKVFSNVLSAMNCLAASEILLICKRAGIDTRTVFDCIRGSSGNSFFWETGVPMIFQGNYDPSFDLALHCKDNQLAFDLARKHKVPIALMGLVQQMFNEGLYKYGDTAPCYSPAKLLEETLGECLQREDFDNWSYSIDNVDGSSVIRHNGIDLPTAKNKEE